MFEVLGAQQLEGLGGAVILCGRVEHQREHRGVRRVLGDGAREHPRARHLPPADDRGDLHPPDIVGIAMEAAGLAGRARRPRPGAAL